MSDILKGELQDNQANTIYPHTEADVVFCADGETAQSKLTKYEDALGNVTGVTDSLEVDDSKVLVSSKALHKVNSSLKANNNQIYMDYHDGKYGINTSSSRGADTFIPFKSDLKRFYTTITGTSALTQYTVGFKPKIILFCVAAENRNSVAIYDGITNKCYYNGYFDTPYEIGSWVQGAYRIAEINDTGFKAEFLGSWSGYPVVILAFG